MSAKALCCLPGAHIPLMTLDIPSVYCLKFAARCQAEKQRKRGTLCSYTWAIILNFALQEGLCTKIEWDSMPRNCNLLNRAANTIFDVLIHTMCVHLHMYLVSRCLVDNLVAKPNCGGMAGVISPCNHAIITNWVVARQVSKRTPLAQPKTPIQTPPEIPISSCSLQTVSFHLQARISYILSTKHQWACWMRLSPSVKQVFDPRCICSLAAKLFSYVGQEYFPMVATHQHCWLANPSYMTRFHHNAGVPVLPQWYLLPGSRCVIRSLHHSVRTFCGAEAFSVQGEQTCDQRTSPGCTPFSCMALHWCDAARRLLLITVASMRQLDARWKSSSALAETVKE